MNIIYVSPGILFIGWSSELLHQVQISYQSVEVFYISLVWIVFYYFPLFFFSQILSLEILST